MKTPIIVKIYLALSLSGLGLSCAQPEENVNRRRFAPVEGVTEADFQPAPAVEAPKELVYAALELTETKLPELIDPIFFSNIQLVSKTLEDEIVIFGKDGNSWVYKPGTEAELNLIPPAVVNPQGSTLYTLPSGQFWIVSPEEVGKRKDAVGTDQGAVVIERFGTDVFSGNKSKISVLFATASSIVLHLETHIVILTSENNKPSFNQFALNSLPVSLGGPIIAAGQAKNKAFWLASKDAMALLEPRGSGYSWSKVRLPLPGEGEFKSLALWLDQDVKAAKGSAMLQRAETLWERE